MYQRLGAGQGKLFATGRCFLFRHCYDLAYDSQSEDEMNRQLRKAQTIRRRLGCSESLTEPIRTKPKGRHRKTFERLPDRAEEAHLQMWQGVSPLKGKEKKQWR